MYDICIIGGGASGMTAAITAAEADGSLSILIIEKKKDTGHKILASGNGRCNLSNLACSGYVKTRNFFNGLGLSLRHDEEGRVYPHTEDSSSVREALMERLRLLGVEIVTGSEVTDVIRKDNFEVKTVKKTYECRKLLIASGGKAAPKSGTTGDGYRWAKKLGHSVNRLVPVLTGIEIREDLSAFAGIRAKVRVSLRFKDRVIFAENGEIQFNRTGISGICVFNMSRFMLIPEGHTLKDGFDDYTVYVDFYPEVSDINAYIKEMQIKSGLDGDALLKHMLKVPVASMISKMTRGNITEAAELIKAFPLHPCGAKGWDYAQVTKGGIPLNEINTDTMESKICRNLYFAGEITDFDGPCGGFNLQNAWETGMKAGKGMGSCEV